MDSTIAGIIAVVVAIIAAIPGLMAFRNQRREVDISHTDTVANTAVLLIDPLRKQVALLQEEINGCRTSAREQRERIDKLERITDGLRQGVDRLIHQLRSHNITPIWTPEGDED